MELENCLQYFMMQQKPKLNRNTNVKRRENARQRRMPAYLIQSNGGVGAYQQILEEIQNDVNSKESHSLVHNLLNPNVNPLCAINDDRLLVNNDYKANNNDKGEQSSQSSEQD